MLSNFFLKPKRWNMTKKSLLNIKEHDYHKKETMQFIVCRNCEGRLQWITD